MAKRKRKPADSADASSSPHNKRARPSTDPSASSSSGAAAAAAAVGAFVKAQSISYGRVDPTYGQRSAIPGLDDYEDEEEDDDENGEEGEKYGGGKKGRSSSNGEDCVDGEALRYLRRVREEANAIPTLLVAPRSKTTLVGRDGLMDGDEEVDHGTYEDGVGDARGWYRDGAYTAAPAAPLSSELGATEGERCDIGRDAQTVYHEALLGRFNVLRRQLAQVPPRYAVEKLGHEERSYVSGSRKDWRMWGLRVMNTEPKAAQLAGMDKESVLRLLRMMGDQKGGVLDMQNLVGEGKQRAKRRRVSAWLWGLLAKLPDRGELVSEEVGVVRDLGKRAVWVGEEMKGVDMSCVEDQMGGEEEEEEQEEDEEEEEEEEEEGEWDEETEGINSEQFIDVEINGDDEEQDFQDDTQPNELLTNGDSATEPRPLGSKSVRRTSVHAQDPALKPIIGPTVPKDLPPPPPSQTPTDNQEEEALSQARARLIARLQEEGGGGEGEEGAGVESAVKAVGKEAGQTDRETQDKGEEDKEGEESRQCAVQATKVLLDMIITIAGEVYGQRDLLEFREAWG